MSVFSRKMDEWAEDEDEELEKTIWQNYGPLLQMSLLFPSWKPRGRLWTVLILTWQLLVLPTHLVTALLTAGWEIEKFNLSSLLLHYWLFVWYSIFTLTVYQFNRKLFVRNHRLVSNELGAYRGGDVYNEDGPKEIRKLVQRDFFKLLGIPGSVGVLSSTTLIVPYLTNRSETSYTEHGASLKLPIAIWYPFPTHEGISHWVTAGVQFLLASTVGIIVIAITLVMLRVSHRLRYEIRILCYAVDTVSQRAVRLYRQLCREKGVGDLKSSDPFYQQCFGLCLKDCVHHHQNIMKLARGFEQMTSWPSGMAYLIGMGVIGLSLINVLFEWTAGNYENVAIFGMLTVCEVLNMYIMSTVGEAVTADCQILRDRVYFTNWCEMNVSNRRVLLNFQVGVTEPFVFKTGPLMNVNMDTLSSILNTAYSFFSVMLQMGMDP